MIYAKLDSPSTYIPLIGHTVWEQALEVLRGLNEHSALGITELRGKEMFVNVHTYLTKEESDCRYEGHRSMIDVQYIIKGGELVDLHLKEELEQEGFYDVGNDFQFYRSPSLPSCTRIHLRAGYFGIFFPEEGHRPQIHDGRNRMVYKAVVKIHRGLFE